MFLHLKLKYSRKLEDFGKDQKALDQMPTQRCMQKSLKMLMRKWLCYGIAFIKSGVL